MANTTGSGLPDISADFRDKLAIKQAQAGIGYEPTDTQDTLIAIGRKQLEDLNEVLLAPPPKDEKELQDRIAKIATGALQQNITPAILGILAELVSLGQIDTVGQLLRNVYRTTPNDIVLRQFMRLMVSQGAGATLKNQMQEAYQPRLATVSDAISLYGDDLMTEEELVDHLAKLGFSEEEGSKVILRARQSKVEDDLKELRTQERELVKKQEKLVTKSRELPLTTLKRLLLAGEITDEFLIGKLEERGYSHEDAMLIFIDLVAQTKPSGA